mgnify:CR=1 FL=1
MSAQPSSSKRASRAPLPELLDRKRIQDETGLPRSGLAAIFQALPVVTPPGHRKVYVRRLDVEKLLAQGTFRNDGTEVRA